MTQQAAQGWHDEWVQGPSIWAGLVQVTNEAQAAQAPKNILSHANATCGACNDHNK